MKLKLTMLALSFLLIAGCNTWQGFGEDVQKAGEKIEQSGK